MIALEGCAIVFGLIEVFCFEQLDALVAFVAGECGFLVGAEKVVEGFEGEVV